MRWVLKCGDAEAGGTKSGGSIPAVTLNAGARGTWRLIMGVSKK